MISFEKQGYWWLPEMPDTQIAGTIVFGHEIRSELRLLGSFQDQMETLQQMGRLGEIHRLDIILGLTSDGKKITLCNSKRSGGQFSFGSFITQTYSPEFVIEGKHFFSIEEIRFHHLTFRLAHLAVWFQRTGKQVKFDNFNSGKEKITLIYDIQNPFLITYDKGHIEFGFDVNVNYGGLTKDFILSEKACVSVYPQSPTHIHELLYEYLPPLINFLELGVGRTLSILEIRGKASADCSDGSEEQIIQAPSIQLYWRKKQYNDEEKELFPHDMLCICSDLQSNLEKHFQKWMIDYQEIKPVMQLFFGKVMARESFSSNSFLNSVQSAESYHRYRRGGTDIPKTEHENRIKCLINASPEEHREWLYKKLKHSNEVGLRKRLKELLKERSSLFELSSSEIESHAHRITTIRNYFTHFSGEKNPDFATGKDFYVYDTLMYWTMIACLLEEMGIEREQAHKLILRNQAFLYFRSVYLKKEQVEIMKVESVRTRSVSESDG